MTKQRAPQVDGLRREDVRTPDEVSAMLRLHALGWGTRRIAAEFGCSRNTVKRYVELGVWAPLTVAGWLARDYERLPETGEAMIHAAMSRIMLRRLTEPAA